MRTIIFALGLLWISLTGGCAGWQSPYLLYINVLGWAGLILWGGKSLSGRWTGPDYAMLATVGTTAISGSVEQAGLWAGYWAVYRLAARKKQPEIHRGALLALAPYAVLTFVPWENPNIVGFNLLGLALLALPAGGAWLLAVTGLLAWPLQSVGGCWPPPWRPWFISGPGGGAGRCRLAAWRRGRGRGDIPG